MTTLDNFRNGTVGIWQQVPFVPQDWRLIHESPGSAYYLSPCRFFIGRYSNHWGSGIGVNNWFLDGMPRMNSYSFKNKYRGTMFSGIISLSDLNQMFNVQPNSSKASVRP